MNALQLVALVPMTLAAAVRRSERRVIARLRDAAANTAERAILLDRDRPLADFTRRRLERTGVLRAAGHDRYYLDEGGYAAYRNRRRTRARVVFVLLMIGVALLYFGGAFS